MEGGREGEVENLLLIAPSLPHSLPFPFLARPIGFILFPSIASGRIDTLKLQHMALYYASTTIHKIKSCLKAPAKFIAKRDPLFCVKK